MPSPPPEAVAPSSASFVKGYAKRGSDQPPFASLLSRLADHASSQDRPAAAAASHARSDDPLRRFDAATVHAPAGRDSAGAAGVRPANEAAVGSQVGSIQPDTAPHALASGQSADRTAKDAPAQDGSTPSSTPRETSHTAAASAPSAQGPVTTTAIDTTGMQAVAAALFSFAGGADAAGAASAASDASDAGKGDDVTISGVKPPPPRSVIAAAAGVAAGALVGQATNAGTVDPGEPTEDPVGATAALSKGGAAPPRQLAEPQLAEPQLAEPQAVDPGPTDVTVKSGPGRLAEDGGSAVADRPHATEAPANPAVNAAASVPSANSGPSAAAPANNRAVLLSEVAVTIAGQARSGKSRFDIRLDPPELGRIEVQLNLDSGGNFSSRLIVERPETLDLLRRDAPQLERALQDAGLNTGSGMQFSLADQGFAGRNGLADYTVHAPFAAAVDELVRATASNGNAAAGRGGRGGGGGLDITV